MEIGPIFRALINHKTRFWLISLEIGLTLAIVANCVNMIIDQRAQLVRPTGMDEENILVVYSEPFAPDFQERDYVKASYEEDLRLLNATPGVRSASAMSQIPLSGGGSSTGRRAVGTDIDTLSAPYFVVGPDVLETLGVRLIAGRDFTEDDFLANEQQREAARAGEREEDAIDLSNVILTQEMADVLFPDGDALGKQIENATGTDLETVVGIIERMHGSWPQSSVAERVVMYAGMPVNSRGARYVVRAEPGMVDTLYTSLETELTRINEGRIVEVQTLAEIKADTYQEVTAMNQLLGGLSILLVAVTSLGIIGLTSFSVTQRTKEIGTRRALGATRAAILRYFLVENWLVTSVGLTLGIVLTYSLNFALANFADSPKIAAPTVGFGMLLLWGIGLLAALLPALRGMGISPVIATRNV